MLPQRGRGPPDRAGRAGKLVRNAKDARPPRARVVDLDHHLTLAYVGVRKNAIVGQDGTGGHSGRPEAFEPDRGRRLGKSFLEERGPRHAILAAGGPRGGTKGVDERL